MGIRGFSQFIGVGAEVQRGEKGQVARGFGGQMIAASRRRRAKAVVVGEVRRGWRAYGMVVPNAESRYGTEEVGRGGRLTGGVPRGLGGG